MAEAEVMSGAGNENAGAVAVSKTNRPALDQETRELIIRASQGDQSCLPKIRALLADGERGRGFREHNGSSAKWLRHALVEKAAGGSILRQEAIKQELDSIRSELEGPDPTPIERLLAERASLCWFIVHWYENAFAKADGMSIVQADYSQRRIDKAHARFLSAIRTLAQVRKLALPTLQLNIARNQVNVAETRS
jgi:hypothetical protein